MAHCGICLFLGPDRPRKLLRIHELEGALGVQPFDRHQLDAAGTSARQLVALCRQRPAASPVRLIVIDQAHRLDRACVDALLAHAAVIAKNACVVLLVEVELSLRHALAKASGGMRTERFPGRSISAVKPFALTDALGSRDVAGALAAVRDQLLAGKEPLELLGLIAWQLHRWVTVKRLGRAGYSAERVVSVTGLHPWQAQRLLSEVARRSLESLQRTLSRCWQLDLDAKRGRTVPELAVEQLVVEMCLTGGEHVPA
jgi:DNA polymerase III delta subunit